MSLDIHYVAYDKYRRVTFGTGKTINISRSGILFHATPRVLPDDNVTIAVKWPVNSPTGDPLLLLVVGHAIYMKSSATAMAVERRALIPAAMIQDRQNSGAWQSWHMPDLWSLVSMGNDLAEPQTRTASSGCAGEL